MANCRRRGMLTILITTYIKQNKPQAGDGYVANKNVFDIQDKTIEDIKKAKEEGRQTIMKLINSL